MRSPKLMAGVVSAAAAVALATMFAAPASAAVAADPTTCAGAQSQLFTDQQSLASARQADAISDGSVTGAADFTPDAEDAAVATANGHVNSDQGFVNALCGTTTTPGPVGVPHPHPWPTPVPTPIPGPVGFPFLNCTQLAARGLHDIPSTSPYYQVRLDADRDGIACETTPVTVPAPGTIYKVINGGRCKQVGNTWVPVTPVTIAPSQTVVYQVIDGQKCKQTANGTWVPVTTVTAPAPCPCPASPTVVVPVPAPVEAPAPATVFAPAPAAPIYSAPAPVYSSPVAPVGPAQTGR